MKKQYWLVILTYILMQVSGIFGVLIMNFLRLGNNITEQIGYWTVFSFSVALLIILFLLRNDRKHDDYLRGEPASVLPSIGWAVGGVFMALFVQTIAANIEVNIFGIEAGSENTEMIVNIIEVTPIVIVVTSVIGPILEEIIFRKILFGGLYKKYNFFISAAISSVVFALVHGEPQHLLLYASMGFTFAFLYVRTKRILVPIFAHVAMNTFVVVIQLVFKDDIERLMKQAEQLQAIIGGI